MLRDYQFTKQEKELVEEKLAYYNKDVTGDGGTSSVRMNQEEAQRRKIDLLSQDK